MRTLILGALEEELVGFRGRMGGTIEDEWRGLKLSQGRLAESDVVVARTGVGKTMSALATQHLIDAFDPDRIIFTGIAGALNPDLEIGDVVVAESTLQYDLDARAAGFSLGQVPFTDYRSIPCDARLVAAALDFRPSGYRVVRGRVLTGDLFLSRSTEGSHRYLVTELGGDAVEMEGASAGLVALVNAVPFLLVRVLSDRADGSAEVDFKRFLPVASDRTAEVVAHVLKIAE